MDLVKGLFLNVLFILILVLLSNLLFMSKHKLQHSFFSRVHLFFMMSFQIVLCIVFSVPVGHGFYYDLRFIPFLIGGIYGGKRVTIGLALVLLISRLQLGGSGFWINLFLYSFATAFIFWLLPRFWNWRIRFRLIAVSFLSLLYSIAGCLVPAVFLPFSGLNVFPIYSVILTLSTFFVFYLCEIIRSLHILTSHAIKYEKMEIVSHLAASISHEVRNPLTSVQGFLQLILEDPKTVENSKSYASLALDESIRATSIINDYLTFAKPHPEQITSLDITEEINKCIEIMIPFANKHGIEMKTNIGHSPSLQGEPTKFRQALVNICKNGIEAMPKNGILTIETTEDPDYHHLHIRDTGIGMEPHQVARLGEPYFSINKQKGTGLGMMVVFRIIEGMGGQVRVTSEKQVGTCVTLSFPRKQNNLRQNNNASTK